MLQALLDSAQEAWSTGSWDVALQRYARAIACAEGDGDAAQAADLHRRVGNVHRERGDLDLAAGAFGKSRDVAERHRLRDRVAAALIGLATVEFHRGNLAGAETTYLQARTLAEAVEDERLVAMIEQNLGSLANIQGQVEQALGRYHAALGAYRRLGDDQMAARALHNLAMAYVDLEQWTSAAECFDDAFLLADRQQDTAMLGSIELNRVELYLRSERYDRARECCDRAFEIFGRLGSESGLAEANKFYGILFRETAKPVLAGSHLSSAVDLARRCQDRLLEAEALSEWALVHLAEERNREALQCLNDAHHLFSELHARLELRDLERRLDTLESSYLRVVAAWGESIEGKDRYTAGHCERVANYACMLAEAVGITGRDLTWLRMGGYLHDVGKIAVPAEILNKPGKLTDEEFRLMQAHTVEGDSIVAELNFPWDIRPAVRWHHERWDGSGYPDGLRGEEIPLTARILCVADVYDALTTTRSYRPAMSRDQALEIMERDVGRFFDPDLFPRFKALIAQASPMRDGRFPAFGTLTASVVAA